MPLTTTEKRDFRKYILSQLETTRIQALEHPRMRNYSRFSKVETTTDWEIAELCKLVLGEELYGSVSRFAHVNNVYTRLVEEGHIYFDAPPDMDEFLDEIEMAITSATTTAHLQAVMNTVKRARKEVADWRKTKAHTK